MLQHRSRAHGISHFAAAGHFVHARLTVKVVLLIVYIVLGIVVFSKDRSATVRVGAWLAALAIYAFIYSVVRAHNPLGFLGRFAAV